MEEKVVVKRPPKSPFLAGVLAFFFPFGIGQIYNRQIQKGLIFLIVFAGLVTMQTTGEGQPFLGIILGGFYIYQIIEAVQTSKSINRRFLLGEEEVEKEEEEFPETLKAGSIFWGAVLIILGAILLLANFEVISYDTVFDFWPVAVIVIGVKLVADYFGKTRKES